MKTRNKFSFACLLYTLFALMMVLSSCSKTELVYGYVPVGEALQVNWIKTSSSVNDGFRLTQYIKVVTNNGDTVSAFVNDIASTTAGYMIQYRNSNPICKDIKVYVELIKKGDSYRINRARTSFFE